MDGQRTPLQDFETLYIGRVRSLPSFAGPLSAMNWLNQDLVKSRLGQIKTWPNQDLAKSRLCAIAKEGLTTRMARIVLVTGLWGRV
jgi:hypothetical protein